MLAAGEETSRLPVCPWPHSNQFGFVSDFELRISASAGLPDESDVPIGQTARLGSGVRMRLRRAGIPCAHHQHRDLLEPECASRGRTPVATAQTRLAKWQDSPRSPRGIKLNTKAAVSQACGVIVAGQHFSPDLLQRLEREGDGLSRRQQARLLCQWLDWKGPSGRWQEMSARKALAALQRSGHLHLPPPLAPPPRRRVVPRVRRWPRLSLRGTVHSTNWVR